MGALKTIGYLIGGIILLLFLASGGAFLVLIGTVIYFVVKWAIICAVALGITGALFKDWGKK